MQTKTIRIHQGPTRSSKESGILKIVLQRVHPSIGGNGSRLKNPRKIEKEANFSARSRSSCPFGRKSVALRRIVKARIRFAMGPARATIMSSRRGCWNWYRSTGTVFPKPSGVPPKLRFTIGKMILPKRSI